MKSKEQDIGQKLSYNVLYVTCKLLYNKNLKKNSRGRKKFYN